MELNIPFAGIASVYNFPLMSLHEINMGLFNGGIVKKSGNLLLGAAYTISEPTFIGRMPIRSDVPYDSDISNTNNPVSITGSSISLRSGSSGINISPSGISYI